MAREQFQTLTEPMYYILLALLMSAAASILWRRFRICPRPCPCGTGTLYAMLSKFEENGVIRMTGQEGRRKSYVITDRGKQMLQEEYQRLKTMTEDGSWILEQAEWT